MKKIIIFAVLAITLTGCGNKEEAIKTATEWTQDFVFRFYTNPRIKKVEYQYCKDAEKLDRYIIHIDGIRINADKRDIEFRKKYGYEYTSNEQFAEELNIKRLEDILWECEKAAYATILKTSIDYIKVAIDFSYEKGNDKWGSETFNVIMTTNTLQVLNPQIKRRSLTRGEELRELAEIRGQLKQHEQTEKYLAKDKEYQKRQAVILHQYSLVEN